MAIDEHSQTELFDFEQALLTGVPISDDETQWAARAADALVKAIKAFRYYSADHPQLAQFRHELLSCFERAFTRHPVLTLEVSELAFVTEGQAVNPAHDLHGSVPFLLFRDGIRVLHFQDGLDEDELLAFVQCIAGSDHANQLEDDLVTLLWEQEFSHIDVQAAEYLPTDLPIDIPETLEQFRACLDAAAEQAPPPLEPEDAPISHQEPPPLLITDTDVFRLTAEEILALRQEVAATIGPEKALGYTDLLFDMLALEEDPALYTELARVLQETLESMLMVGDLDRAADLLDRLGRLAGTLALDAWQRRLLTQLPESVAHTAWLALIVEHLRSGDGVAGSSAMHLLAMLPPAATPNLVRLLGEISDPATRALLRDILVARCQGGIAVLTPFLEDPRDGLVCDVVQVLGRLGDVSGVSMLARTFSQRSPAVRKAVVDAVAALHDPGADALLIRALRDSASEIRCRAAVLLGARKTPLALEALLAVVSEKRFQARPPAEVRAFLDGVGRTGSTAALPLLHNLLLKTPWLGRKHADRLRPYAAHALALLGTPEALALLESGAASRDETIRAACRQAMKSAARGTAS
jgi:hypothetical protein